MELHQLADGKVSRPSTGGRGLGASCWRRTATEAPAVSGRLKEGGTTLQDG